MVTVGAGNIINCVTIPRTNKSQQNNGRHTMRLPGAQTNLSMSRSYQHSPTQNCEQRHNNGNNEGSSVTMRRSSSVPCKKVTIERGSTSSSDDSGFSPGSPNTSATLGVFSLEQAIVHRMNSEKNGTKATSNSVATEDKVPPMPDTEKSQDTDGESMETSLLLPESKLKDSEADNSNENSAQSTQK